MLLRNTELISSRENNNAIRLLLVNKITDYHKANRCWKDSVVCLIKLLFEFEQDDLLSDADDGAALWPVQLNVWWAGDEQLCIIELNPLTDLGFQNPSLHWIWPPFAPR